MTYYPTRDYWETRPPAALGLEVAAGTTLWRGRGCDECRGTGYKGRVGLFELVRMTDELRDLILSRASEAKLIQSAARAGTRTLREEGLAHVVVGDTTFEEVLHVTQERT